MNYEDLPKSEKRALMHLAQKRNKMMKWHYLFLVIFSVFVSGAITAALYPNFKDAGSIGRHITNLILISGFIYWGYLSIIQPRILKEIEKIRNENGA